MPPLSGFSDNPFATHNDMVVAALATLRPLIPYFSPGKARIRLPVATGTHFDETAAQLEGFARPLWAVCALLGAVSGPEGTVKDVNLVAEIEEVAQYWVQGFAAGTDPADCNEYWGSIGPGDQRMVEAEVISYALLSAPNVFFHDQDDKAKRDITTWLRGMTGKDMPPTNWRWFRVFSNLALVRVCGVALHEVQQELDSDLAILDSFYIGHGWSGDGPWLTTDAAAAAERAFEDTGRRDAVGAGRQVDYYSGSFAIQFSQLLYVKFAADLDPDRVARYQQQARDFGSTFWRYFDSAGAAIPFGRSLTYRFACGGYFAALAMAKVTDMPVPLSTAGAIKGFLLRHMRWWAAHSSDIFCTDGILNIGWLYPNMFMCEDYNSPQSVYWCLKTLAAISLGAADDFWTCEEQEYPTDSGAVVLIPEPRQILVNHPRGNHHFLLSPAQFVAWPLKASQAKYSKFAYSSAFAFSVPTGPLIQQMAPDSTLALSRDGAETWATKWKCSEASFPTIQLMDSDGQRESVTSCRVTWYPWGDREVEVNTTLIPPTDRWPDWHIRKHQIKVHARIRTLHVLEGGFAVSGRQTRDGAPLPTNTAPTKDHRPDASEQGILEHQDSVFILSTSGASGLSADSDSISSSTRQCYALKPDSNTNIACQRTLIPVVAHSFPNAQSAGTELTLVTKVFAISRSANGGGSVAESEYAERWADQPVIAI